MTKIRLQGFILIPAADLELVKSELGIHKALTLKEAGCLTFKVTQDDMNPLKYSVYEEFVDQAAFDLHQARVKSSKWGQVTQNVERHYQISCVD